MSQSTVFVGYNSTSKSVQRIVSQPHTPATYTIIDFISHNNRLIRNTVTDHRRHATTSLQFFCGHFIQGHYSVLVLSSVTMTVMFIMQLYTPLLQHLGYGHAPYVYHPLPTTHPHQLFLKHWYVQNTKCDVDSKKNKE